MTIASESGQSADQQFRAFDEVKRLVESNQLADAILKLGSLEGFQAVASNLSRRLSHIDEQTRKRLITYDQSEVRYNNLADEILGLISFETSSPDEAVFASMFPQAGSATPEAPPFILPQLDIPFFTGREAELRQLESLLLNPEGSSMVGIVGLTGTGGMGKSALAFHFARTYRDRFPDGVIGLRVDSRSVDTLAQRFAYHARVQIDPGQQLSAAEIMQSVFRYKRALLIFDNVEEATTRALQPGGNQCAVLVTTRNRGLLRHFGIPVTAQVDLHRFELEETKELLCRIVGEPRVTAEPEAVQEIHELVGGMPLALRIVGSTLADQSFTTLAEYAGLLRDEKARLSYLCDADDPDLDVRTSFGLSLKYLEEDQVRFFACLGACAPEGLGLHTAQVVSEQDEATVRGFLGRLIRLSLVNEGTETGRFVLHPLLFLFARELAQAHDLLAEAEQRHTEYFSNYAHEHRGLSPVNLDALETELDAMLLTARRLTDSQRADYNFYLALEPFLQARGYWTQALELIDAFLQVARASNDFYVMAQFLIQRGQFFQLLGRLDAAEASLLEGQTLAHHVDDSRQHQHVLSMMLNSLGGVYQRQGKFEEAVAAFQQSYAISEKLNYRLSLAMVNFSWGKTLLKHNKPQQAINKLKASFGINEDLQIVHGMRIVTPSLIRALVTIGQEAKAQEYCRRALKVAPGDKRLLRLQEQLSQKRIVTDRTELKTGHVKRLIRNLSGYLYGFIVPDDGSEDIYFGEDYVDPATLLHLTEGMAVVAEVEVAARGPRARRVWENSDRSLTD